MRVMVTPLLERLRRREARVGKVQLRDGVHRAVAWNLAWRSTH
ncbi:MAG TPA: hypothetical protein VE057_21425 [Archangium sp.]|nr:hypothetical protein [Archangium sp.]